MSLVNLISAVGNNSSVYPLIVRDCGIEIPTKVALTYNQNLKDSKQMANNALRERLIDEYGTSIVWLGGIPVMNKVADYFIRRAGFNPNISSELLKEQSNQGGKYNIKRFSKDLPKETAELEKVLKNRSTYEKLLAGKLALSTIIPIAIMGYSLPKLNFALTSKLSKKQQAIQPLLEDTYKAERMYELGNNNTTFKGAFSSISTISTVNKMAITDGGLTAGRVYTSRNKYERMENLFKNLMMMFLNFVAPIWIASGLDKLSSKVFNLSLDLDPKLLNNKQFIKDIKENKLKLPQGNYIDYIDKNPKSNVTKLCEKYCGVKILSSGVRDPRAYVDEKKIAKFLKEVRKFAIEANKTQDVELYARKALKVKSANILANVGISSFLLAYVLPKVTFVLRKKFTGLEAEPGLLSK